MLLLMLALFGCPKQAPPVTEVPRVEIPQAEIPKAPPEVVAEVKRNFSRVNFEFDSDRITNPDVLGANARLLLDNPSLRVEVQGHCDDRGTSNYNVALGDRRAAAIVRLLTAQGVPKNRLDPLSFGEERPLATGEEETVWAQNRRAEFRIVAGSGAAGTVN